MEPKKSQSKTSKAKTAPKETGVTEKDTTAKLGHKAEIDSRSSENGTNKAPDTKDLPATSSTKRKRPSQSQDDTPSKARRKSSRGAAKPSPSQVLNFLLSPAAVDLCRPKDEIKALSDSKDSSSIKTYSTSELSPFEELIGAIILSRPISHALGVRSIRTIFNPPYNFTTPKAIQDAGPEKRLQALWDARTQHKDKTAAQLGEVADTVVEKFNKGDAEDIGLGGVREMAGRDIDEESDLLTKSIKGIGKTGMSIFFRRIQWLWEECYPYVDERTEKALGELGLPEEAGEMQKLVEENWGGLGKIEGIAERQKEEVRKRRAFVIALERATGAQLESNISEVLEEAGKT